MHLAVNTGGIPHLAKNERDTRISCTRHHATSTCAAFIEESRMKSINATNFTGNPGVWGTLHLLGNKGREYQAACADFARRLPNTHQINAENTPIAVPELRSE